MALAPIVVDEITLVGSRCGPFGAALDLLANRRIDARPLVDAVYPLDRAADAFERRRKKVISRSSGDVECGGGRACLFPQSVKQGAELEAFAMWQRIHEAQSLQRVGPPEPAHDHQQLDV